MWLPLSSVENSIFRSNRGVLKQYKMIGVIGNVLSQSRIESIRKNNGFKLHIC